MKKKKVKIKFDHLFSLKKKSHEAQQNSTFTHYLIKTCSLKHLFNRQNLEL